MSHGASVPACEAIGLTYLFDVHEKLCVPQACSFGQLDVTRHTLQPVQS